MMFVLTLSLAVIKCENSLNPLNEQETQVLEHKLHHCKGQDPVMCQFNTVHINTSYFSKTHFNINLLLLKTTYML